MNKLHSVVMLPTDDKKAPLGQQVNEVWKYLRPFGLKALGAGTLNHIHFTSDDEIKEGDWYIDDSILTPYTKIVQCTGDYKSYDGTHNIKDSKGIRIAGFDKCHKIIATTDSSLLIRMHETGINAMPLPQIHESFVKAFVKAEGKIDEVMLEMEIYYKKESFGVDRRTAYQRPKLREDGTVIIHQAKMYTRQQMHMSFAAGYDYGISKHKDAISFPDWMKKYNL